MYLAKLKPNGALAQRLTFGKPTFAWTQHLCIYILSVSTHSKRSKRIRRLFEGYCSKYTKKY